MFINQHYDSYRLEVVKDSFPNYADFAFKEPSMAPESIEAKHPNCLEYLKALTENLNSCVRNNDEDTYLFNLELHQDCVFKLFQKMFFVEANTMCDDSTKVLKMVGKYGWRVYKYSGISVIFDRMILLPVYHSRYRKEIDSGVPCFNADEWDKVIRADPSPEIVEKILDSKKKDKLYLDQMEKDPTGIALRWSTLAFKARNHGRVTDWSGKLR